MKKLLLIALIAVSIITSSFTAPASKEVNYLVSSSFSNDYPHASNAKWNINASYARASFVVDNIETEVFYKLDGEYIGTSQAIALQSLPLAAKRNFAKKYSDYTVKEAIKFEGPEETTYYISAECKGKTIVLKADETGISTYINSKN